MNEAKELTEDQRQAFNANFHSTLIKLKGMSRQQRRASLRNMEKRKAPKELIDMFKKYLRATPKK